LSTFCDPQNPAPKLHVASRNGAGARRRRHPSARADNCGKSAIVEALKVLSANEGKDWFIRHSAPETSIQLEITEADGKKHSIQWTKKVGTGGWYEIDGTRYERLNRTVPDDLKEILRLQSVGEIHPHFGEQKRSLFLTDEKAPDVARFFSAGTDISLLMGMQAELSTEKRNARQDKTRITTERDRFQNHERILEPLPELEVRLQEADRAHRELENALEKQKQVRQTVPQLVEATDEELAGLDDVLSFPSLEEMADEENFDDGEL
jgi:hypothetical protein